MVTRDGLWPVGSDLILKRDSYMCAISNMVLSSAGATLRLKLNLFGLHIKKVHELHFHD